MVNLETDNCSGMHGHLDHYNLVLETGMMAPDLRQGQQSQDINVKYNMKADLTRDNLAESSCVSSFSCQ